MNRWCNRVGAAVCRTRWRRPAVAREPSDRFEAVIRWQRTCGRPGLCSTRRVCAALTERGPCYPHDQHEGGCYAVRDRKSETRSEIRACQPLHRFAIRAMDPLFTACPSLRAHEPNPAWRAVHGPGRRLHPEDCCYRCFHIRIRRKGWGATEPGRNSPTAASLVML